MSERHSGDQFVAQVSIETIARETGLSTSEVQRLLPSLSCDPSGPCTGGAGCQHRGLLRIVREATHDEPAAYAFAGALADDPPLT